MIDLSVEQIKGNISCHNYFLINKVLIIKVRLVLLIIMLFIWDRLKNE